MSEPTRITVSVCRNELEDKIVVDRALFGGIANRACQAFIVRPRVEQHDECTVFSVPANPDESVAVAKAAAITERLREEGLLNVVLEEEINHHQVLA